MFKNRSFMLGLGVGIIAGALLLQLMMLAQSGREAQTNTTNLPAAEQSQTGGTDALLSNADVAPEKTTDGQTQPQGEQPASSGTDTDASSATESSQNKPADSKGAADTSKDTAATQKETGAGATAQPAANPPSKPTSQATEKPSASAPQSTGKTASPAAEKPQTPSEEVAAKPTEPARAAESEKAPQAPAAPAKPADTGKVEAQKSEEVEASRVSVKIESGMNLKAVSKALENAGIVKDASEFQRRAAEAGVTAKLQVGNYSFKPGDSYSDIIKEISTPRVD